jgi:hypothetical protein
MEQFLQIKIKELLNGEQLNFENIVPITLDLCVVIKKKQRNIPEKKLLDLLIDTCVQNILSKYKTISNSIEILSDSEDEAETVKIKEHFDSKVKLLEIDIALLDYSDQIITGVLKKSSKTKKRCLCF